jgi:hypothetical protein
MGGGVGVNKWSNPNKDDINVINYSLNSIVKRLFAVGRLFFGPSFLNILSNVKTSEFLKIYSSMSGKHSIEKGIGYTLH